MGYLLLGREYRDLPRIESHIGNDTASTSAILEIAQPGDLLLVKTTGIGYAFGRRITRNRYDHIAVVLPENETLNIVYPKTVILPLSTLGKPRNTPLILRPNWTTPEQREEFIREMLGFLSVKYDLTKTFVGIFLTCLNTCLGLRVPKRKLRDSASRWICTEAILVSLFRTFPEFEVIKKMKLDYNILGFATTNDFLRISKKFPDLLKLNECPTLNKISDR